MDALLHCALELYRAAQDTPVDEFRTLALKLLHSVVPFRSATWSNLDYAPQGLTAYGMHLFNEPDELMKELPAMNSRRPVAIELATRVCGEAVALYTPSAYSRDEQADMRDYIRRYGHEHNIVVADLERRYSRGEWLGLYRPESHALFSERDRSAVTLLMPHLVEAMTINRRLALGREGVASPLAGARALVKLSGHVIHCGARFCELLGAEWTDWRYTRLPRGLVSDLCANGVAELSNGVRVTVHRFANLMLLTAKQVSPVESLSNRELQIVRLYADGKSYKEIARDVGRSPSTIRNVIQNAYRKLQVDNKGSLAKLLQAER